MGSHGVDPRATLASPRNTDELGAAIGQRDRADTANGRPSSFRERPALKRTPSLSFSPSDFLLFRPPQPTYSPLAWPGELCMLGSSVCLVLERLRGASRVLLFCHGTSSDLGQSRRSLEKLRDRLDCHVVAVEYPGYGLLKAEDPKEESINRAVREVFEELTGPKGWSPRSVVVMGRSLGSGPAARLAREREVGALLLLAPFTSVKEIAGDIVGDTIATVLNLVQWNNRAQLKRVTCPTLLLHGLKDGVVPHVHSLELYRACRATVKYVALLRDSDHNRINWPVACDVYAKPFLQMACPHGMNRSLGASAEDVTALSQFRPSSFDGTADDLALQLLSRAEDAWERRRRLGGTAHRAAFQIDCRSERASNQAGEFAMAQAAKLRAMKSEAGYETASRHSRDPSPSEDSSPKTSSHGDSSVDGVDRDRFASHECRAELGHHPSLRKLGDHTRGLVGRAAARDGGHARARSAILGANEETRRWSTGGWEDALSLFFSRRGSVVFDAHDSGAARTGAMASATETEMASRE